MKRLGLFLIHCVFMRTWLRVFVGVKYINRKALKKEKQFIIVANHNSHLDSASLLASVPWNKIYRTHPVAAADYFGSTGVKAFLSRNIMNVLLIKRKKDNSGPDPIAQMLKWLDKKHSLILFPEGTRGEPGKMQEFKKGIGILLKARPEICFIPVYLKGFERSLPKGKTLLVPMDSFCFIGEPVHINSEQSVEEIVERVRKEIIALNPDGIN